jgi:predicted nucleotidyltransferase component of viral defense system
MLVQRKTIHSLIHKYMIRQGYDLKPKSKSPHSLDSFVYRYVGLSGNADNIKIEINYSLRAHVDPSEYVDAIHPFFSNDFQIHRLSVIEIFAGKINALLSRAAARDLYDVNNMIKNQLIKDEHIVHLKKSVLFYFAITSKTNKDAFDLTAIDRMDSRKIKRDLTPVLSKADTFNLEEAKEVVNQYLLTLLVFTPDEKRFMDLFMKKRYEPALLFDHEQVLSRIRNHPMALWRTRQTDQ